MQQLILAIKKDVMARLGSVSVGTKVVRACEKKKIIIAWTECIFNDMHVVVVRKPGIDFVNTSQTGHGYGQLKFSLRARNTVSTRLN